MANLIARINLCLQKMPMHLLVTQDGRIGIVPIGQFPTTVDSGDGAIAMFFPDHFLISEKDDQEEYRYGQLVDRDMAPLLCKWVRQLKVPNLL